MARLDITPFTPPGSFPAALPIGAGSAAFAFTNPGTPSDGISWTNTGREILLVQNTDAGTQTVTISSVAFLGRTGDITAYSMTTGTFAAFGPFDPKGWNQATTPGKVYAVGTVTGVKFAVITLPANIFPR